MKLLIAYMLIAYKKQVSLLFCFFLREWRNSLRLTQWACEQEYSNDKEILHFSICLGWVPERKMNIKWSKWRQNQHMVSQGKLCVLWSTSSIFVPKRMFHVKMVLHMKGLQFVCTWQMWQLGRTTWRCSLALSKRFLRIYSYQQSRRRCVFVCICICKILLNRQRACIDDAKTKSYFKSSVF